MPVEGEDLQYEQQITLDVLILGSSQRSVNAAQLGNAQFLEDIECRLAFDLLEKAGYITQRRVKKPVAARRPRKRAQQRTNGQRLVGRFELAIFDSAEQLFQVGVGG